jgi:rhodanese-related sulfurtransferase
LPNTIGTLQATEVLKIILGIGEILSGKLLIYDALCFHTQTISFSKNPKAIEKGIINGTLLLNSKKTEVDLSPEAFFKKCNQLGIVIIDVRELEEIPEFKGENVIQIPLGKLEEYSKELDKNQEIVLFCQTGQRSQAALNYLIKSGFVGVFHLGKGIESLKIQI